MTLTDIECPICNSKTYKLCEKTGDKRVFKTYTINHCPNCSFSFVTEPRTDYEQIYSHDYYNGLGPDPLANYAFEAHNPSLTIRQYEWKGLERIFETLKKLNLISPKAAWLDYGCGLGGLVRHGRERDFNIFGYEPYGNIDNKTDKTLTNNLNHYEQYFLSKDQLKPESWNFVTAIEVIEHVSDPLDFLKKIRPLMKTNGLLFLTTGNAAPFLKNNLQSWAYADCPDLHVSFFTPQSLAEAMRRAGFTILPASYFNGFTDIIKFKILKNLKFTKSSKLFSLLPWPLISRLADLAYQISALPIAIAS
ncbi:MAG: class I SAM-dependent methyltransferase [Deltaproteobacteria bacterium]|jgi:2-polyprenyl-3-methyl-5-hydroxy-6-metoxy-1,4-benzoquinol methylase|nr:class I SAM-dependent methyltransferase [Deltaproteobacteria bacterium]